MKQNNKNNIKNVMFEKIDTINLKFVNIFFYWYCQINIEYFEGILSI